ncbi:hypothetical protein ACLOJK_041122 [Asimina triloba]
MISKLGKTKPRNQLHFRCSVRETASLSTIQRLCIRYWCACIHPSTHQSVVKREFPFKPPAPLLACDRRELGLGGEKLKTIARGHVVLQSTREVQAACGHDRFAILTSLGSAPTRVLMTCEGKGERAIEKSAAVKRQLKLRLSLGGVESGFSDLAEKFPGEKSGFSSWEERMTERRFWRGPGSMGETLIILILVGVEANNVKRQEKHTHWQHQEVEGKDVLSHSCIHGQILDQRRRPGRNQYSVTPQVYAEPDHLRINHRQGRALLGISQSSKLKESVWQPIRIYLNYDAVGHSPDRDCRGVGDVVKAGDLRILEFCCCCMVTLGEPPTSMVPGLPACDPLGDPPIFGDCWYNCTLDDVSGEDKKHRLRKALGQTADWFRRALAVEPVKGNLRLSGYSACGQDGGVQLPREYVEEGVTDADLVLLVTTRPTTGNTLAWAVACERDQWGRAIAGHVNVAPRHLTAEAETLLSATLIHEVMHVLGFDPHAFAHFRDERKRRRGQLIDLVTVQSMDERLGRMVTRVVLPRVVMHSRYHYGAFAENFTGLELEDGGGRGTSGSHWEKRLLMNEIMTGSVDTRSVVSKMTLALLEDSGWYQANYSMADRLDWGRYQGTDFVTSPCNQWKGAYHCNTTQLSGCTYNREAEGYCPIVSYSGDLPQWARYFSQANKACTVAVDGIWKVCPEAGGPVQFHEFPLPVADRSFLVLQALALVIAVDMENVTRKGSVNVRRGTLGLTAQQCSLHGGVCDNGVCEFRCSDYAGYTCQNSSTLFPTLSVCGDVLARDAAAQHCAPSEPSILQQLEAAVVMPNYNRLIPGSRTLFSILDSGYCAAAAKRLACWISIQRCDRDGDNRLRVCHSACRSYNAACGACLDCSDQTLFSSEDEGEGQCTGYGDMRPWWLRRFRSLYSSS